MVLYVAPFYIDFLSTLYTDRDWYIPAIKEAVGFETMNTDVPKAIEYVRKRIVEDGGQLEAPTDYINLQ